VRKDLPLSLRSLGQVCCFFALDFDLSSLSMMTKRTGFGFALLLWGVLLVAVDGKDLPSVCVCECCRWTGLEKMQCADPGLTAFEVDHCSSCNVRACARQFDVDCPERGSKVKSYCVRRFHAKHETRALS